MSIITLQKKIKNSTFKDVFEFYTSTPSLYHKDLLLNLLILDKQDHVKEFLHLDPALTKFNKDMKTETMGETYLHIASYFSGPMSIEMLVKKGIDVNAVNDHGKTALHLAVQANKIDNVRSLLYNGANKRIKNFDDIDSIEFAILCGHEDIVELLEKHDTMKNVIYSYKSNKKETFYQTVNSFHEDYFVKYVLPSKYETNASVIEFYNELSLLDVWPCRYEFIIKQDEASGYEPLHNNIYKLYRLLIALHEKSLEKISEITTSDFQISGNINGVKHVIKANGITERIEDFLYRLDNITIEPVLDS